MAIDVYQIVTDRIIDELNKGVIPWHKPWVRTTVSQDRSNLAYSRSTGKAYSLLNQILLDKPGEWATFQQISNEGGHVKKGEKSSVCVFWKWLEKTEKDKDTGEEHKTRIPFLKYINVFHVETQTEGLKVKHTSDKVTEIESDENGLIECLTNYFDRENIEFNNKFSNEAYYSPLFDKIVVPDKSQFENANEYFATLSHESVHSTGHKNRLNRFEEDKSVAFGDEAYSKEELVAEIGSASLMNIFSLETENSFKNSAAYIGSWIKQLKSDKRFIVSACSKAEKAVKYILNVNDTTESEEE